MAFRARNCRPRPASRCAEAAPAAPALALLLAENFLALHVEVVGLAHLVQLRGVALRARKPVTDPLFSLLAWWQRVSTEIDVDCQVVAHGVALEQAEEPPMYTGFPSLWSTIEKPTFSRPTVTRYVCIATRAAKP